MTRDRKGQTFVPGFLTSVYHTPVMSEGNLPGGGGLFAACTRAVERAEQLTLCPAIEPGYGTHPEDCACGSCPEARVIQRTDTTPGGA